MANENLPPNGEPPSLPPVPLGLKRFQCSCTDAVGNTALLHLDGLNHQAALAALLAWLCNHPVEVRKIVIELQSSPLVTATTMPKIFRG
jgi:hypothetical protein